MGIQLIALVLIPCAMAVLGWLLRRSEGALFRISLLPGLVRGHLTGWIRLLDVPTRLGRVLLRSVTITGYLTANIEETFENVRFLASRMKVATGKARRSAEMDAFHLAAKMWPRPAGIVVIASLAASIDLVAGITMVCASRGMEAVGHLTTPLVMGIVIWGYSEIDGDVRTSSNSPKLGPIILARWTLAIGSVVALVGGQAWASGSSAAELLGRIALVVAVVSGILPMRRWIEGEYLTWRRWVVVGSTPLCGVLAAAATVFEMATTTSGLDGWKVVANLLGASALFLASMTLALIALDPPPASQSVSFSRKGPTGASPKTAP